MVVLSIQAVQFPIKRGLDNGYRRSSRSGGNVRIRCGIAEPSGQPAPMGQKTKYNDGFFEKAFMTLFARKMEKFAAVNKEQLGQKEKGFFDYDYDSFVDVSRRVMQGRNRMQQQEVVREVLLSMLPPGASAQFKQLFPPTKWAEEFNVALTVPFFHWLVGPYEMMAELCLLLKNSLRLLNFQLSGSLICKKYNIEPRAPECYFSQKIDYLKNIIHPEFARERRAMKMEYEECKVRINGLVSTAEKVPEEGWTMQDGIPWSGNNVRDHPGMVQVFLGDSGVNDIEGNKLPTLVYVSREKRPGFDHHQKSGAMNSLVGSEKGK